ncbi:radical SAM family heme chaperone HemW [Paracoccus pacificus]|uniref:Heme chaperone HemW n=1 Tax=Paracoccus pacificus TaxID=1463598 RepID=A0ABW4R306_9RHOB
MPYDTATDDWRNGGFGLYVHWPFCASKCPYCDFNSHVAADVDHDRWLKAYRTEIARLGAQTGPRVLDSIFFGGGTPSLMRPDVVAAVIDAARAVWPFSNSIEITLEANPGSVEAGKFHDFGQAGVNRLSMGVQALNDDDLRRLGRLHSVAEARAAFDIARKQFARVSFDLIYARQGQDRAAWRAELTEALDMTVDHLSLYQLTIEDGTAFGARHAAGKLRDLPSDDLAADMYLETQDICAAAGMGGYETSNHARPGAESRHNLIYWRQGDYAGVGPGAHGRLTLGGQRHATETIRAPETWLDAVETQGTAENLRDTLTPEDRATEYLLMSMRLAEGMRVSRYAAMGGAFDPAKLADLVGMGLVEEGEDLIRTTVSGRPVLNAILRELAL